MRPSRSLKAAYVPVVEGAHQSVFHLLGVHDDALNSSDLWWRGNNIEKFKSLGDLHDLSKRLEITFQCIVQTHFGCRDNLGNLASALTVSDAQGL